MLASDAFQDGHTKGVDIGSEGARRHIFRLNQNELRCHPPYMRTTRAAQGLGGALTSSFLNYFA